MLKLNTKNGNYIVEASVVAPLMIIAVIALSAIIPIINQCQSSVYIGADEAHLEAAKMAVRYNPAVYPLELQDRILSENDKISSCNIDRYNYKFERNGVDDLFAITATVNFKEKNPLGLFSQIDFKLNILARGFTGKDNRGTPTSEIDFTNQKNFQPVYIFPNWGIKYHGKTCTYVTSNHRMIYLSQKIKKAYRSCSMCHSKKIPIGSPVFYFEAYGDSYHLSNCKVINKYYIEIEKSDALKKGYIPCEKCKGE